MPDDNNLRNIIHDNLDDGGIFNDIRRLYDDNGATPDQYERLDAAAKSIDELIALLDTPDDLLDHDRQPVDGSPPDAAD